MGPDLRQGAEFWFGEFGIGGMSFGQPTLQRVVFYAPPRVLTEVEATQKRRALEPGIDFGFGLLPWRVGRASLRNGGEDRMKHHIMIALGLLMGVLFAFRMADAILEPGLGGREAYLAGGLLIAAYLTYSGWREWRAFKAQKGPSDEA